MYVHACDQADARYLNNEATEKGKANFVPWSEIVERRDEMIRRAPTGTGMMEVVIVAMHTMIPPARSDYGKLRVYRPPHDPEPRSDAAVEPNRIVWTTTNGAHNMHMVLNEYKTRNKKGVAYEADLPADLTTLLVRSLEAQPRKYLVHNNCIPPARMRS